MTQIVAIETSKLGKNGRLTIPKRIREHLGIVTGSIIEWVTTQDTAGRRVEIRVYQPTAPTAKKNRKE